MALHTASGMTLASIGLWLCWPGCDWYADEGNSRDDESMYEAKHPGKNAFRSAAAQSPSA